MSPVVRRPELPQVIVGTAGHVDHGKTALVRLLTGCETDKLKEEKERGLSINLGFAPCLLPGNRVVGIIDVPGHIDFIRNMVAGAASIDILILVIAADDGIMPQTTEHMQIVKLLRTPRLMVALTKIDLVDSETLELAQEEIRDFVAGMGYPDAPVVPVSNVTLDGISQIQDALDGLVREVDVQTDSRPFRMNVERVFSVKGMGTVATGVPLAGTIAVDDPVELLPCGPRTSIRAIQNYRHDSSQTGASICSALNLRDAAVEQVSRGMTVCSPNVFQPVSDFFVTLQNVTRDMAVKHNSEIRFHAGTAEVLGKLQLLEGNMLKPGLKTTARVVLDAPLVLVAGDRYILRRLSPSVTLGGGMVIGPADYRYKRSSGTFQARLRQAADAVEAGQCATAELLSGADIFVTCTDLEQLAERYGEKLEAALSDWLQQGYLADLGDNVYLLAGRLEDLTQQSKQLLGSYYRGHRYSLGMLPETYCGKFGLPTGCFKALRKLLTNADAELVLKSGKLALKSYEPPISKALLEAKEKLQGELEEAGGNGMARGNAQEILGLNKADMQLLINVMLEENDLVMVGSHLLATAAFADACSALDRVFQEQESVDIKAFRDATGAGRNFAVMLLEKFDSLGITKRVGEGRVLANQERLNELKDTRDE